MKGFVVERWAGWVAGMAALALGVAWAAFGWPVLLLGVPLFVGVLTTVGVLAASEGRVRSFQARRHRHLPQAHWRRAAERGDAAETGLMSGFFEISPQAPVPPIGDSRIPSPSRPVDREPDTRGRPDSCPSWAAGRLRRLARPAHVR